MMKTVIGVDLAKRVIQVCVYANNKVRSNRKSVDPNAATNFLIRVNHKAIGRQLDDSTLLYTATIQTI